MGHGSEIVLVLPSRDGCGAMLRPVPRGWSVLHRASFNVILLVNGPLLMDAQPRLDQIGSLLMHKSAKQRLLPGR